MKRTGNKRGLLLAVLLPLLGAAQPGGGVTPDTTKPTKHEFTIQQAVDYAKKNNLNVKNALLDVQYQEQVNKEVTSRAYPGINASLSTTYNPNIATQVIPNFISPSFPSCFLTVRYSLDSRPATPPCGLPGRMWK